MPIVGFQQVTSIYYFDTIIDHHKSQWTTIVLYHENEDKNARAEFNTWRSLEAQELNLEK